MSSKEIDMSPNRYDDERKIPIKELQDGTQYFYRRGFGKEGDVIIYKDKNGSTS